MAREFNDVQFDVEFTQASSRTNLTSKENISLAFGKLSKWYGALVPTGGSSGQFLGWNSDGTAKWVSNPNTDTKVRQSILSTNTNHPLLLAYSDNTITTANIDNVSYRSNGLYANPATGPVTATNFAGKINGHTVSIDVPSNAKFTDTVYTHPTYTSKSSGLYKITVDGTGHVSAATAATKADIPALDYLPNTTKYALSDSVGGSAKTADKLTTARTIAIGTGVTSTATSFDGSTNITIPVTGIKEAYLTWGGEDFTDSFSPLDAALEPRLGANRLEMCPGSGIKIERTTDGGTTWTEVSTSSINNAQRSTLFSSFSGYSVPVSATSTAGMGDDAAKYMMRITLDTSVAKVYTYLLKFILNISTNGCANCYVKLRIRTAANVTAGNDTWLTWDKTNKLWSSSPTEANTKCPITGWNGYNVINFNPFPTYGNKTSQYRNVQFIFGCSKNDSTYSGLSIINIQGYGGVAWIAPSNMAKTGHLYSWNGTGAATFPSSVTATNFNGKLNTMTISGTNDGSYNLNNFLVTNDITAGDTNGQIKVKTTNLTIYTHPTYTSKTSGLYKITVDSTGHVSATAAVAKGDIPALDYVPNTKNGVNAAINLLDTGSSTPIDADYYISQYVNGGTTTTTYHRRPMSALWSYVKGKADSVYSPIGHTHNNYLGAAKIGNYWGMTYPDGTATGVSLIRTTRSGIIPYAANTDVIDGNVSSLGTSTWTFANGYINNLYYKDLKNVSVVAGNTADNGIDKMTGSFFFAGDNLIGGINDWVGIQAGSSVDKWQIVGSGTRLLYRQNDTGGTDSADWTSWNGLVTPDSIVGNSGISITKLTNNYGSGDDAYSVDVGVYVGHTNSVTAQTDYNKPYVKYDTEGHITESSHFVHLATGTGGVSGWVKLATMKHIKIYDNTPIELTMSQRGNHLIYRLHILFKSVNGLDPDIDKFVISMDTTDDTAIRAYIIKSATSTWDLYILKRDSYEAIAVSEFNVGKYFPDHMEWTWQDEQTDASVITGGTEATKHCYGLFLQSDTTTGNYRPIVMGTTDTNNTANLNATITGQGFVSNSLFVKPSDGHIYANVFSTSSYLNDTGAQLTHYGLYAKSYKEAALPAGGDYSYSGYVIRVHDGKAADNAGMLLTIGSGGLTMVGGGESATNLSTLISDDQRDSNTSRTRLDVGGTLNTAFQGSNEQLILSSDYDIYFLTNCNTIANRKPVVLDSLTQFYPGTTLTGSIGTSSYYWNDAYFNNLYLSNQAYLKKSSGGTYYVSERTDTNTKVSFGIGDAGVNHGIYSYTLNGWIVNGDASKVYIRSTLYNPTDVTDYFAIPFFGATPSTGSKAIYNNNGLRYSTREGTTSQPGIARLIIGNGVSSTSDANKEGVIRIYSVENGFVDLLAEASANGNTLTLPALTGTLRIQRNALQYDNTSDFASYSWHKFAEITINAANDDRHITFLVSRTYRRNVIGILTAHIRTTGTKIFDSAQFEWSVANEGIVPSNFVMVYTNTANTSCKVELWYKQEARYDGWIFEVLKEHRREFVDHGGWTLYSSSGHGSATYTSGTGTIVSKLGYIQNAPGIYHVIGTQTASTSVWTGKIDVSELYDGLTIAYYLPYASTSTAVTLNLTLVDGTTTGAINCYVNNNSRLTTQYGAGSTIILTYWSAGSIKVSGTATTDNRWSRCEQNTNTNVTQGFVSANTNRPLLMSYYGVGNSTTTSQVVYRNDAIYANPSQGAIHAKKLVLGTPYSVDTPGVKGVITLYQAGSEILPAVNIEAETGIAGHADSTVKIPTNRSGVVRLEEIVYSVTGTPTSDTIISNLTFSYGTPRYLKICTRIGSTYANGITNIFDIGLNTDVGNGVILTWGTPGQSGVSTYIQYANVRISSINSKYSINFLTGSAMQLTTGSTPLIVSSPNIFIYEIIAVY